MFTRIELQKLEVFIAQAAEDGLLSCFQQVDVEHKTDGNLLTAADVGMQQRIQDMLA